MKDNIKNIFAMLASLSLILIILITSIDFHAFNEAFYESEYKDMHTAQSMGMTHHGLMDSTKTLLDYLQDKRNDIKVSTSVYGNEQEVFNDKETMHMVDVKNLYQNVLSLRKIAILCSAITLIYLFFTYRKKAFLTLSIYFNKIATIFLCVVSALAIWAVCDFYSFWTAFHQLFFTNDLWLLNPATDLMINMFPEAFFFHMVLRITITFAIIFGSLLMASKVYLYKWRKANIENDFSKGVTNEANHFSE
ncbi:MAG: TIGR01906 family membrane protein [Erysipelotrichaceae bacterium]